MFTTRDRQVHTRKRKIISHTFSQKSVLELEPHVRHFVGQLLRQWDRLHDKALEGGLSGQEGEGWISREGRLWLDCFPCKWACFIWLSLPSHIMFCRDELSRL